jgi:hypothetical protein
MIGYFCQSASGQLTIAQRFIAGKKRELRDEVREMDD